MHLYLLLISQGPALQTLQRYEVFRKSQPVLAADFEVSAGGQLVKGRVVRKNNERMFVNMQAPGMRHTILITPSQALEVDFAQKVYEENPGTPGAILPRSRLTGIFSAFPSWIMQPDLRKLAPPGGAFVDAGKVTVDGIVCDQVRCEFTGETKGKIEAAIDAAGRPHEVLVDVASPMGRYNYKWRIRKMEMLPTAPANSFTLNVPNGFVPNTLPWSYGPFEVGSSFPSQGWRTAQGGELDLKSRFAEKGALIALLGEDSEPSARSKASLAKFGKDIPVIVLTDVRKPSRGTDGYDPTGKLIDRIDAPATPLFVIVDKAGKVKHLWMGYDAEASGKFETEVRNAISGKE